LRRCRREIETLQTRIASERAQPGSGVIFRYLRARDLAKHEQDLETARALVPQLEDQLRSLEKEYHDLGYDDIEYSTWSAGEMRVGGRGIAQVGGALQMGGAPAGLKPTGDEFNVALTAVSVLQLGKWAISKALIAAPSRFAGVSSNALNKTISPAQHVLLRELFKGRKVPGLARDSLEAAAEISRRALANSATSAAQRLKHLERLEQIAQALKHL